MADVTTLGKGASIKNVHPFKHRGREYRIFKWRGQAKYYVRIQHKTGNPKGTAKCLDTTDADVAISNAKIYIDAMNERDWGKLDRLRMKSPYCTCGDLADRYEERCKNGGRSVRNAALAFLTVVAEGNGWAGADAPRERAREARASVINRATMLAFRDRPGQGRTPATINTMMREARAMFHKNALDFYDGLKIPKEDIAGFRSVSYLADPRDKSKRFVEIPTDDLIEMDEACEGLLPAFPLVWATYQMMRKGGLRNEEVEEMRWHWFVRQPGGDYRCYIIARPEDATPDRPKGYFPKGMSGYVPISKVLYDKLREIFPSSDPRGYVLPGTKTSRKDATHRHINDFVRPWLGHRNKKSYNLRMQFGSEIAAEYGIETACSMCRHADLKTTWEYYHTDLRAAKVAAR